MKRKDISELAGSAGLGAWTAFGVLTMVVIGHDGAPLFGDEDALSWSVAHRPDIAPALARGLTATGTGVVPYALVILAALLTGRTTRQRVLAATLAPTCLATGQALRYGVMSLIARPRPALSNWAGNASGWSFPSGHTTTAALTAGLVILAICVRSRTGEPRSAWPSAAGASWSG